MSLSDRLYGHKKKIAAAWLDVFLDTYKSQGAKFFKETTNEFANPVGATFRSCLDGLLDYVLQGNREEDLEQLVDGVVRIRAVQGFKPSVAVEFAFSIKQILKDESREELTTPEGMREWDILVARMDTMTRMAFDLYMACRETVWKHKANHLYNRTNKLLEKSNLLEEVTG
ncbi:MAG: hypothetical protein CSA21_03760 [Deltaproteobacteria bacterium]|nr:MAG: hypothetical protein CSA21_03760 [Deltaproteobacteria bacterium]